MNKHIVVDYSGDGEGRVEGLIEVTYAGTLYELVKVISDNKSMEEIYVEETDEYISNPNYDQTMVDTCDILTGLGIEHKYIPFIVDCPYDDLCVEGEDR